MLYLLSKLIPVRFRSTYTVLGVPEHRERAVWWQWRGRVFRHRAVHV